MENREFEIKPILREWVSRGLTEDLRAEMEAAGADGHLVTAEVVGYLNDHYQMIPEGEDALAAAERGPDLAVVGTGRLGFYHVNGLATLGDLAAVVAAAMGIPGVDSLILGWTVLLGATAGAAGAGHIAKIDRMMAAICYRLHNHPETNVEGKKVYRQRRDSLQKDVMGLLKHMPGAAGAEPTFRQALDHLKVMALVQEEGDSVELLDRAVLIKLPPPVKPAS